GGTAVRLTDKGDINTIASGLLETVAAPVMFNAAIEFPAEVTEVYPAKLPPLRGDAPTLVIGKVKGEKLSYKLKGAVDGRPVALKDFEAKLPAPEVDHFFLAGI